jgi:hypothetical protein
MQKYTINLPDTVTFKRAGEERTFAIEGLPGDIIEELVIHGLTQKIGDAAAGKSGDEATAAMQKVHDALREGNWGVKRSAGAGDGLTDIQRAIIAIADESIPAKDWKRKIDGWADMTTVERRAAKWAILADMDTSALAAEAKRRASESVDIKITI